MKNTRKTNWRVVVEPRRLGDYGGIRVSDNFGGISDAQIEREYEERCEEIKDQLKRHVDNVGWVGVEHDTEETCSHCGSVWEDEPNCCDAAVKEWDPSHGTEVQP